ncbi:hypothetical protein MKZ38_000108 [Zalerion maritima]|uniref:Carboxymuconolactone decarboxylase-like domain-containing protein n=1 Tax=Zalerion maritima TaxID=339359 RepID=A0AAD5RGA8_9PEZI|nr:hypothetical protein MKZ38_000108 [Zalerion maritima]
MSPPLTIARTLDDDKIDIETLKKEYGSVIGLVEELIGVVPNAHPYMAIWETGYRNYNLLVPALFNLPGVLFSWGRLKSLVGLSAYAASRASQCMYCSAHTCTFALKRGAKADVIVGKEGARNETEEAVMKVGEGMGSIPATLTKEDLENLRKCLNGKEEDLRWIAYGAAVMGYMNKSMDVLGIQLERESVQMVEGIIRGTGWDEGKHAIEGTEDEKGAVGSKPEPTVDGLWTFFRVIRLGPEAMRLEKQWIGDAPGDNAKAKTWLEKEVGFSFEILDSLGPARVVQSVAAVIRDNLDPKQTNIGQEAKCLSALVFARCVANTRLEAEARRLTQVLAPDVGDETIEAVLGFADDRMGGMSFLPSSIGSKTSTILDVARASSMAPAVIPEDMVNTITDKLESVETVEAVFWLSLLQMLHRLDVFHSVDDEKND